MENKTETVEEEKTEDKVEKAERLNEELGKKIEAAKEIKADEILSGKSDAGQAPAAEKKEPSDEDYAEAAKKGIILK